MRIGAAAAALCLAATAARAAEPQAVTLEDAVALALKVDPLMESAQVDRDRSKLGVLRAQLDRITLRIDGQLQELWNKTNIGGAQLGSCTLVGVTFASSESGCSMMGGAYMRSADQTPALTQGLFNLAANLQVPLFAGFRVDATVRRAQRTEEAAIVQVRRQQRETALAAARAFWSVRRLELLRDVQRRSLERLADAESVATARVRAGLAPQIDKNRAISRRLQQTATLADYDGQIGEAIAQLGVSLGLKGDVRLVGELTFPENPPPDGDDLVDTARRARPELEVARLQLEAQRQAIRIARSAYYPQVGAFGLFQYGNNQLSIGSGARDVSSAANPFAGLSGTLTLGANLSMNFFDTLHTYTTTRDAEYEQARLVSERRRAERAVDADVLTARAHLVRLQARRPPLREARELARDNAKILEARYKNGDALVIELLDAQLELQQAEASLVDLEAQLELAWLELRATLGEPPGRR